MNNAYPSIDWDRLRKYRTNKVKDFMRQGDLEAIIVVDPCNIRYVADLRKYGSLEADGELHLVLMNAQGEVHLITQIMFPGLEKRMPWITKAKRLPAWRRASIQEDVRSDLILQSLAEMGIGTGRIGIDFLPFQVKDRLQTQAPALKIVSIASDMLKARMVKNEDEIALLEIAAANNESGMRAALEAMVEGATEHDVVAAALGAMAEAGIEAITHYPGCRSGERTLSDYLPIGRRLRAGDTVILDMGSYSMGGYACDYCRTGIVGDPSDSTRACYRALYDAHLAGISAVKPGVMASNVHEAINQSLREAGYPESIYANGHGIGLGMIELPTIASKAEIGQDTELKEGMVICLEPITFTPQLGVKLEDVVHVTATGGKPLTRTPYWRF
jgi:Xaa-Pro aminopeptidase